MGGDWLNIVAAVFFFTAAIISKQDSWKDTLWIAVMVTAAVMQIYILIGGLQ